MNTPAINNADTSGGTSDAASKDRLQRLFFALWPDDALRQRLVSRSRPAVQATRGRPVPVDNLHITLVFLGDVDASQRECLELMATGVAENAAETTSEKIAIPTFELTLDRFGHWSRPRVLWLGANETPEPLTRLVDRLSAGARQCGLSIDARPYRAHLTLMRKVSRAPEKLSAESLEPLSWPVSCFVLVRSVPVLQGVSYEVLREWRLRASAED